MKQIKTVLPLRQYGLAAVALAIAVGALSITSCETPADPPTKSPKSTAINIAAIKGVAAPVTGGAPVKTITENAQYSGTVTWNGNPSAFAPNTQYTATIFLTAKDGYTLQGVAANFFIVEGAIMVSNNANSRDITAVFPPTSGNKDNPTVIDMAAVPGVTAPVTGATPVTSISENSQYSGTVTWNGNPSAFAANTQYIATITLTPKTGYTLQGVAANFFSVAGTIIVSNNANSGVIIALFPQTGETADNPTVIDPLSPGGTTENPPTIPMSITSVNISIIAPVNGTTPSTTAISDTSYFSIGTVSWLPPSTTLFLDGTVYTAVVTLTANSGYTFTGLSSATINGQDAEITNNPGATVTLSHTFPATDTKVVTSIAIKTQPAKLSYTHGDTLDLTGLVVTLTHDDTTTEDVTAANFAEKNVTAIPSAGDELIHSAHNEQPVKIKYGELECNTNTLTVSKATPAVADFIISGTGSFTYNGSSRTVTVTPHTGKSDGIITVKYNGSETKPSAVGTYTVTFDVGEGTNFSAGSGFSAGNLTIITATFTTAPTLTLTASNAKITYTWTASNPAADSYDVYWKAGNSLSVADVKTGTKITGAASGGEITGLTNGTAYSVVVMANKAGYNAIDSMVRTGTPILPVNAVQPVISAQPQGGILVKNETLSVTASVTDGGTLSYQWYRNTANNTTGGTVITGAIGSSYTLSDIGAYYCYVVVTNTITNNGDGGIKTATTTSSVAAVTVELVLAEWARTVSAGNERSYFNAVAVDSSGNVYAAGYQVGINSFTYGTGVSAQGTNNLADTSARVGNVVLVKYDLSGTALWTQTVSTGSSGSKFSAVAVDSFGNVYAAGEQFGTSTYTYGAGVSVQGTNSGQNVVLVKYNSSGTAQWARTVSAGNASAFNAVVVDSSGNVYAAGEQFGTSTFTYGAGISAQGTCSGDNVVLVKYDSSGTAQWARTVSAGNRRACFNAVAVDSSGNVYAAGIQYDDTYTYGEGVSAQGTNTKPFIGEIGVLVKYDSSGTALWARAVTGARDSRFSAVAVDSYGNVYTAGRQVGDGTFTYGARVSVQGGSGNENVVLVKYDSGGTALWARTASARNLSVGSYSLFNAVVVDSSGSVYAAGHQSGGTYTYGTGVSTTDGGGTLVKYDSNGNALWAKTGGSLFDAVAVDSSGNVYAAGYQSGTGTYTYGTGVSAQGTYGGGANVVLVKYKN